MSCSLVGEGLNKVAADPEVEVAMFEILEIQKIVESKARITMIPEKGGILAELLASTSRSPDSPPPLRPMRTAPRRPNRTAKGGITRPSATSTFLLLVIRA
jgi:hypothetical protein